MIKKLDSKFKGLFDVALVEWKISKIRMWSPAGSFAECDYVIEEVNGNRLIGIDFHLFSATVIFGEKDSTCRYDGYKSVHTIRINKESAKSAKSVLIPKYAKFCEDEEERIMREKYQKLLTYLGE